MTRRDFLKLLAALPALAWLRPEAQEPKPELKPLLHMPYEEESSWMIFDQPDHGQLEGLADDEDIPVYEPYGLPDHFNCKHWFELKSPIPDDASIRAIVKTDTNNARWYFVQESMD